MSDLRPIERQKAYEAVLDQIRELILNGTWKPGRRIPPERELIEMLSVGRSSIREALRILEAMGFIESRPGDGSYIKCDIDIPTHLFSMKNLMQKEDYFLAMMEARELIESQIAYLAAERATEKDIKRLEDIVEKQLEQIDTGENGMEENILFHLELAQVIGNEFLFELQQLFFKLSRDFITELFTISGRSHISLRQHNEIINAIKKRKPNEAHGLMLDHLRSRYLIPKQDAKNNNTG